MVLAAPGATMIYGSYISREENGKISLSGPLSNLLLIIPFAGLLFFGITAGVPVFALVGIRGVQINAMIAAFNLLPLGPLDGVKILSWNAPVYIGIVLVAFGVLFSALNFNLSGYLFS